MLSCKTSTQFLVDLKIQFLCTAGTDIVSELVVYQSLYQETVGSVACVVSNCGMLLCNTLYSKNIFSAFFCKRLNFILARSKNLECEILNVLIQNSPRIF